MIKTYGLFWKAGDVFWGRQNRSGTLLGARSKTRNAVPVDFREQRGIYALYSAYDLVYVGQTGAGDRRLLKRLKDHLEDHLAAPSRALGSLFLVWNSVGDTAARAFHRHRGRSRRHDWCPEQDGGCLDSHRRASAQSTARQVGYCEAILSIQ